MFKPENQFLNVDIWHLNEDHYVRLVELGEMLTVGGPFIDSLPDPCWFFQYSYKIDATSLRENEPHAECFRLNNSVDGDEFPATFKTRSLTAGDIVRVGASEEVDDPLKTNWLVANLDWRTIYTDQFETSLQVYRMHKLLFETLPSGEEQ